MSLSRIILLAVLCFVIGSCGGSKLKNPDLDLQPSIDILGTNNKNLNTSTEVIRTESRFIQKESTQPVIVSSAKKIEGQTDELDMISDNLEGAIDTLVILGKELVAKDEYIAKLEEEVSEGSAKAKQYIFFMLATIIGASVLSVGLSIFMYIWGNPKFGLALGGASIVVAALAAAMMQHWSVIAWAGFAIIATVIGIIVWQVIVIVRDKIREKEKYKLAFQESVATVEVIKPMLPEEDKKKVFGPNGDSLADSIQSESTRELIKEERSS